MLASESAGKNVIAILPADAPARVDSIPGDEANRLTLAIARHAKLLFIVVGLLFAVAFNGQWRIGLDSAHYLGLADGIASGRGYSFGGWAPHNIYPGLPVLLAGLQVVFGRGASAPCVAMLAMAGLTLVVTYRLMRLHYPKWIAVTVTCGVGTNAWFLQQSSEIMTDVPFVLGVVTALYGWDRLRMADAPRARPRAIAILVAGLALAAVMRPTFLILAAAWGAASFRGALVGPNRKFHVMALVVLLGVWAAFVALDPRSSGFHPLSGGYEREAAEVLSVGQSSLWQKAIYVLNDQLPAGFFGEQLSLFSINVNGQKYSPTSILGSLLVLAGPLLLFRRHAMWAILAWLTVLVTVVYSAEPRYYIMIMPILMLGWLMLLIRLAMRLPRGWGEVALAAGMALVTVNNLSASVAFVRDQRSIPFLPHYHNGKWMPAVRMAEAIKRHVPPGEAVLGPSGSVMSYLSGRHVFTQREIFPRHGHVAEFPAMIRDRNIGYAVFPAPLYRDKEPALARLMERGIMRAGTRIADTGGMFLAELKVFVPAEDWTRLPRLPGWQLYNVPPKKVKRAPAATVPAKQAATKPVRKKKPVRRRPATTRE